MCGICGIVDTDGICRFSEGDLETMANVLRHRGPDDEGRFISGSVGLAFRRLSIVDLKGGHQPMSNEDGTIWIVFNGEIYNHPELRPVLEQLGHRYRTNSDTETILHLYEEYGETCVHHLQGMFAFAIWDTRRNLLFCARDRLGIKPFYYARVGKRFVFASEIKALLEIGCVKPTLNHRALPEFSVFGYLSSDETLFEGVRKLLPGHHLTLNLHGEDKRPEIKEYWDLDISQAGDDLSEPEYLDRFRALFADTVRLHLMSDVPVGVFLSGGLDSSSIAAVMTSVRKDPIQTFSVGYVEDQFSELRAAREVARHIRSEHHEVVLGHEEFFASLRDLTWHEDEPMVWPSSVSLYYVSRLAREKVKVVLTGEGGDEMFAGYLKYRAALWNVRAAPVYTALVPDVLRQFVRNALARNFLPDPVQRKLRHSFLYYPNTFEQIYFDNFYSAFPYHGLSHLFSQQLTDELSDINAYENCKSFLPTNGNGCDLLIKLLYLDAKTYLVELLMKQDQMSMATSIESRVPFLDHKLAEFAMSIPTRYKVRGFSGKYLLRRAMAHLLPPSVIQRTKKGFPTPIQPWLQNQLFDRLSAILTDGRLESRRLFRADYVTKLLEAHRRGHSRATDACWRLLTLELWSRIFLDRDRDGVNSVRDGSELAPVSA
jgi:asparagine synthase (glutamine-hydrolysing)